MVVWLCLLLPAFAGSVYINGVRADELPVVSLVGVNVRIDVTGNLYIDAPKYQVQVVGGAGVPAGAPAPAPSVRPAPSASVWYLVSEDEGSSGGVVEVYVNDRYVRRLESGQAQVLVDLSGYVRPGANRVQFVVRTAPAGRLAAYIGSGDSSQGVLRIDAPAVSWRSAGAPVTQEFTFTAP
ncbi:MAG: hypothetical protein EXR69_14585 [Myxococcales bacterium]|nr:hypothetical protein [Myxococcales bacterium]